MVRWWTISVALAILTGHAVSQSRPYYGKPLGKIRELEHGVNGDVYAVDSRTIHLRNFNYDGQGPDAFFYLGSGSRPTGRGYQIPDENGKMKPLGSYRNENVTLTLPSGVTLDEVQWISVWCRAFSVDFGHLVMPSLITDYPRPQRIGALKQLEHDVTSGDIVVVDAQTLLVPDLVYDGSAPDAHFWVGKGSKPSPNGQAVADENGSKEPLRRYNRKTVVITLPGDLTVFDIDYVSVWCEKFFADFGHVIIDKSKLNVPPSLKMLGVKPQTKLNCEVLDPSTSLEVRWAVAGESIVMQLVSNVEDGQYMSFGLSGHPTRSVMIGGDVVVAWLDRTTGQGYAHDYYLEAKAQCAGGRGSCPDAKLGGKNGVRLLNSALINGFSMLTFQRPLAAGGQFDKEILTNTSQAVIWAIGDVNQAGETSYHSKRTRGNMLLDFGRTPFWNCDVASSSSGSSASSRPRPATTPAPAPVKPWTIPAIKCNEPADRVFYAQIGPTGGKRGYSAITGRVGWGIAWYINGLLVPEINVVRGQTYTFVVEGGLDPTNSAKFHPLYITDDPEGGYEFKSPSEKNSVRVFAGVSLDAQGKAQPTATGRLCSWESDPSQPADSHGSFGSYQRTLQLECKEGQPGILQWTPDADTPDTVYYQCFTHRYLGWKINVVDSCGSGDADYDADYFYEDSLPQPSVAVEQTVPNSLPLVPTGPSAEQSSPPQYPTPGLNQVEPGSSPYIPDNSRPAPSGPSDFDSRPDDVPVPSPEFAAARPPPSVAAGEKMNVAVVPHGVPVPPELGPGFFGPPPDGVPLPPFDRLPPPRESAQRRPPAGRRGAAPAPARRPVKQQRRRPARPAPETLQRRRSDSLNRREQRPPPSGVVFGRPLGDKKILGQQPQQAAFQAPPPPPGHKFDEEDIVLETDFIPVKHSDRNNPPLAFEVNEVAGAEEGRWADNRVTKKTGETTEGAFLPSSWGQRTQTRPSQVSRPRPVSIPLPESVVPVGPSQTADRREAAAQPQPAVSSARPRPPSPPPQRQQSVTHQQTPAYQSQTTTYQQQGQTYQQQRPSYQQQGSTYQQQQQQQGPTYQQQQQQQGPTYQQQQQQQAPTYQQQQQQQGPTYQQQQQQQGPTYQQQQQQQGPTYQQQQQQQGPTYQQQQQQQGPTYQQQQQQQGPTYQQQQQQQGPTYQQQQQQQGPTYQQQQQQQGPTYQQQQQQQGPTYQEQSSSHEEQPPSYLQPAPPLAEGVPLPPHLTEDILPGAVVFRPDEDPRAAIAAAKNRLRNQPGRRQQQQQQRPVPAARPGLLSGPASFLSGLLGYIPGLGAGRRRASLGRGGSANPHRSQLASPAQEPAADNAWFSQRSQPKPEYLGTHGQSPPAREQVPAGGFLRQESYQQRSGYQSEGDVPAAEGHSRSEGQPARLLQLPVVPELQPMFERQPFQPSPLDGASFRPVSEVPQPTFRPTEAATVAADAAVAAPGAETAPETAQGAGARQEILEDVWRRMRGGEADPASPGDRRKRHLRRDAR